MVSENRIHVVLVEDNPGDAYLLQQFLQEAGIFRCETFATLAATLAYFSQVGGGEPVPNLDIVLLDLHLPDSQGLDTLKALLTITTTIPIVILTGLDDDEMATAALQEGAQDYLIKGEINRDTLIRSLRYGIERARLMQQIRESNAQLAMKVQERTAELQATIFQDALTSYPIATFYSSN